MRIRIIAWLAIALLWAAGAQAQTNNADQFGNPRAADAALVASGCVVSALTPGIATSLRIGTDGGLCVDVTVSASVTGFTSNGTFATLTATGSSSASTSLSGLGTSVAFQNNGGAVVSCIMATGTATATTNKILVQPGGQVVRGVGTWDHAACIDQAGSTSNLVVLAGGSGLGNDYGGGSGSGGETNYALETGGNLAALAGAITSLTPGTNSTSALTIGCYTGGSSPIFSQTVAIGCDNVAAVFTDIYGWADTALGAPSNYGTSPGAVEVPGVNAFVTNSPTVKLNTTPSLANGNGVVPTQGGLVLSASNGLFDNLLQSNAVLSATNGIYTNLLQGNVVLSSGNPIFASITNTPAVTCSACATSANQTNASQKTQIVDGSGNVIASTSNALNTDVTNTVTTTPASGTSASPLSPTLTTTQSTLTRPANTTAYAGTASTPQLVASSTTAGSVTVPSFAIATSGGYASIPRITLNTSATSGWGAVVLVVTLYTSAGTYTNGDGGTYALATGSANLRAKYTCTLVQEGDGANCAGVPQTGNAPVIHPASGTSVYWDVQIQSSATPISGQTFVLTPEIWN
jgi:hypothetical protein